MCKQPFDETLCSSMLVYLVITSLYCAWNSYCRSSCSPNSYCTSSCSPKLKSPDDQFIIRLLTSRTHRPSEEQHTGNWSIYNDGVLNSHILSEQCNDFFNEHIVHPHVEKHYSHLPIVGCRFHNDACHNE